MADEHGTDDQFDERSLTLYESIARHDYALFERLLAQGRDVNEVYVYDGKTSNLFVDDEHEGVRSIPVVIAATVCASDGDDRYLRRLAAAGADVNAPDPEGHTPLAAVVGSGPFADVAVRTLAELGADLYGRNRWGQTHLDQAIQWRYALAAVALLEAGFDRARARRYADDPEARHWLDVVAPAEYAVRRGDPGRLRKALGDGLRAEDVRGRTFSLLALACRNDHPELVRLLLASGADPDYGGKMTSFAPLLQTKDPRIVADLVAAGADVAAVRKHLPRLKDAVGAREPNVARLRLVLDVERARRDEAAQYAGTRSPTLARLAQQERAAEDAAVLRGAVRAGNAWALRELAAFGLDLFDPAAADPTALLLEALRNAEDNPSAEAAAETARLLLDAGADPNAAGPDGVTGLMVACRWADAEVVSLLLEAGADRRRRDGAGRDWADHARRNPRGRTRDFVTRFLEGREGRGEGP